MVVRIKKVLLLYLRHHAIVYFSFGLIFQFYNLPPRSFSCGHAYSRTKVHVSGTNALDVVGSHNCFFLDASESIVTTFYNIKHLF